MLLPVQVTFRDMPSSAGLREYIRNRAAKLDSFYERITACRVVVEAFHRHHHHGKRFHVRIDLTVPGGELVVGRNTPDRLTHEDPYACLDEALDDAQRILQEWSRRRRGDAKHHDAFAGVHVGSEVRFAEELGDKGPRATVVEVPRHH
jgi:ribosome-associated translation inhibitor RaiA